MTVTPNSLHPIAPLLPSLNPLFFSVQKKGGFPCVSTKHGISNDVGKSISPCIRAGKAI